jgi:hypothetical protein
MTKIEPQQITIAQLWPFVSARGLLTLMVRTFLAKKGGDPMTLEVPLVS